ncbi:quinone-dependent dihydroorotate dehydrogenase [Candidatus Uhrbacteria bacterium]|nr:quinone-dependent dihydroorotate dehydrogenase [Candidatus Uhrbacteria bacterium]
MIASNITRSLYRHLAKPYFFARDPEMIHDRMTDLGKRLGRYRVTRDLVSSFLSYQHPSLAQTILGIPFKNPIGLAAGFDKNAELTNIIPSVGFGFEEVGSITGEPCDGNAKPRLWRLPASKGLLVHYGLKNDGCETIASRLRGKTFSAPLGTSIAKTNSPCTVDVEAGIADYEKAFRALSSIGDYFTINISCPNAFGGEPFTDPARLDLLLNRLDTIETKKPIFLKLPADLPLETIDQLIAITDKHRVHGLIAANLTKKHDASTINQTEIFGKEKGGISGKPVEDLSNALISHLYQTARSRYILIGCGGVFSAQDAYEKIRRGASLIQLITGMIFEGPQLIGEINRGLVGLLRRDGYANISQAIGSKLR